MDALISRYSFKLKGTGPISYHLGCDFFRDSTGPLCMAPKMYIECMLATYAQMFGCKPRTTYSSPLECGDHPEMDSSDELDNAGITKYRSLIVAAQWLISLGCFDIATASKTLSSFHMAPRLGHLDHIKRIYGYVSKMQHGTIRFRTALPDFSHVPLPDPNPNS